MYNNISNKTNIKQVKRQLNNNILCNKCCRKILKFYLYHLKECKFQYTLLYMIISSLLQHNCYFRFILQTLTVYPQRVHYLV